MLGYLVHSLGAYLHFHPFLLRAEYGDVQTLIAVGLRHRKPVAQSLGIRLIHVGNHRISLPAVHLLFIGRRVENDAYGKQVVYAFKFAALLLHLLPYRMDALGASLDVKFQPGIFQSLGNRSDKAFYISIARLLGGIELVLYHVVCIVLKIFQA